jgi:DNA-binding HxlR family transcriptional regulator
VILPIEKNKDSFFKEFSLVNCSFLCQIKVFKDGLWHTFMKKGRESLLSVLAQNGTKEILEALNNSKEPLQFKDLRKLVNPKTGKPFSSSTISGKIKILEEIETIENAITTTKKRKHLGYAITDMGKESLKIFNETHEKLEKL